MYCTDCGAKNPDDFRFCASCGKPRAGVTAPAPVTPEQPVVDDAKAEFMASVRAALAPKEASHVARGLKRFYLEGAASYVRRGRTGTPFQDGLNSDDFIGTLLRHEFTTLDIAHLTAIAGVDRELVDVDRPDDEGTDVWLTYLQMLRLLADQLNEVKPGQGQALVEGAFEARELVYYNSQLEAYVEEKDWAGLDELTEQYVEEAEGTNALHKMRAAVKAAYAKMMLGDRSAARRHLEEVPGLVVEARAGKHKYTGMDAELMSAWIQAHESDSARMLSMLRS
jgi:hypothetical protein